MKRIVVSWAAVIAGLALISGDASGHDGTNGYISWADIHYNASGTGHLEYDWYYTGHEGCQGDDACVYYTMVQRWYCSPSCSWSNIDFLGHGTVHAWQYDHSAADSLSECLSFNHSLIWDCHEQSGNTLACGYYYRHRPQAYTPYQTVISVGPWSNYVFKCPP